MKTYYLFSGKVTKPSTVEWFSTAFPSEYAERVTLLKELNLADPWVSIFEDDDNYSYEVYFETEEDFNTFINYSKSLEISVHRQTYHNENNIIEEILNNGYVEVDPIVLPVTNT